MSLWMRWVDFRKLRDLLTLISESPGALRSTDLDELGVERGILVSQQDRPLGPSSRYHHRRTLERLQLISKDRNRYVVNSDVVEATRLVERHDVGSPLSVLEKMCFANLVLRQEDCQCSFFRLFTGGTRVSTLAEFVETSRPVVLQMVRDRSDGPRMIRLIPAYTTGGIDFIGADAVQAIHFGMRPWCIEQLGFMDELYRVGKGYTLYGRYIEPAISSTELERHLVGMLRFENDWATVRVGDFILEAASSMLTGLDGVRRVVERWLDAYPSIVAGVATNERFIVGNEPGSLRPAILRGFAHQRTGAHISHLQVHRDITRFVAKESNK